MTLFITRLRGRSRCANGKGRWRYVPSRAVTTWRGRGGMKRPPPPRSDGATASTTPARPTTRAGRNAGQAGADGRTNGGMWVACLAAGRLRRVARWDQYSYIVSGIGQAASTRWSQSSIGRRARCCLLRPDCRHSVACCCCWEDGMGRTIPSLRPGRAGPVILVSAWRYYRYCSCHQCRRVKISLEHRCFL